MARPMPPRSALITVATVCMLLILATTVGQAHTKPLKRVTARMHGATKSGTSAESSTAATNGVGAFDVLQPYLESWDPNGEKEQALCSEYPAVCQCKPRADRVIVVDSRMPKCGSTSLWEFLQNRLLRSSTCRGCEVCLDRDPRTRAFEQVPQHVEQRFREHNPHSARENWDQFSRAKAFMENPFDLCDGIAKHNSKGGLVGSQQFFTPFRDDNQRELISFISVIRDTPSRCRSRFYFEFEKGRIRMNQNHAVDGIYPDLRRFITYNELGLGNSTESRKGGSGKRRIINPKYHVAEDMVIKTVRDECLTNYATRWFCGMQKQPCFQQDPGDGSVWRKILAEAKRVVAEDFDVVSTFPHLWEAAWLMNVLHPINFGKAQPPSFYSKAFPCDHCAKEQEGKSATPKSHDRWSPPPFDPADRKAIDDINPYDAELFQFVSQVFHAKMYACAQHVLKKQ